MDGRGVVDCGELKEVERFQTARKPFAQVAAMRRELIQVRDVQTVSGGLASKANCVMWMLMGSGVMKS